ncbi:MAG: hypothetical protein AAGC56_09245, partial [Pseudomonadota bacterium]
MADLNVAQLRPGLLAGKGEARPAAVHPLIDGADPQDASDWAPVLAGARTLDLPPQDAWRESADGADA